MATEDLPKKISFAEKPNLRDMAWFIYGPPGIGKSTLASGFENALYLWTSPVAFIDAYKMRINQWKDFTTTVKRLQALGGERYGAVVIDTIDLLWLHAREHVLNARGIEHETDMSHGKGFDMVRREFIPEIAKLATCGYTTIFISHAQVRDTNQGRGVRSEKIIPTLQNSAKNVILPICDVEAYIGFNAEDVDEDTGIRRIFFQPTGAIEAKDWTGRLPKQMKLDINPKVNVDKFKDFLSGKSLKSTTAKRKKKTRKAKRSQ